MKKLTCKLFALAAASFISVTAAQAQTQLFFGTVDSTWDTTTPNWYTIGTGFNQKWLGNVANLYTNLPSTPPTITIVPGGVSAATVNFFDNPDPGVITISGGTLSLTGALPSLYVQDAASTAVISSYIDATAVTGALGTGAADGVGTLKLDGGGAFAYFGQSSNSTLWFDSGTYNFTSLGAQGYNYLGGGTFKFTINSGITGGGTIINATTLTIGDTLDINTIGTLTPGAYIIASYTTLIGNFNSSVLMNGAALPDGYSIDYHYNNGTNSNNIALVASVPEPSTWAMLLGGLGMLTMFRRRRA